MLLKRAADIAEALYSVPRPHSQLQALPSSPAHGSVMGLGSYPSQLGVSIGEPGQSSQGEWSESYIFALLLLLPLMKLRSDPTFAFSSRLHSKLQQFVPKRLPLSLHSPAVRLWQQWWDDWRLWNSSHDQSWSSWFSWF